MNKLARALGWFSIGLGVAELAAPRRLTRALGIDRGSGLVRAFGAREIGPGVALLRASDPAPWLWARVAGDAMDLAALAAGFRRSWKRAAVGAAIAGVAAVTVVDVLAARRA